MKSWGFWGTVLRKLCDFLAPTKLIMWCHRRKSNPADTLKGVSFTTLGLGDSNYTRFMAVSRSLRARFADLGATQFYGQAEADEVDGIEDIVDKWVAGLWPALKAAVDGEKPSAVQVHRNSFHFCVLI